MTINESIPNIGLWDAKVLATDISSTMLDRAAMGVYDANRVAKLGPKWRTRYFECVELRPKRLYRVKHNVRSLVYFARLNLMEHWPMRGPFDVIFCRNVMIYFDKPTQNELVKRFWEILAPNGTLFIGHSESLTGVRHHFRYVQPTVYEKA
jgi:chemotaxis protein methyltransferase CheR